MDDVWGIFLLQWKPTNIIPNPQSEQMSAPWLNEQKERNTLPSLFFHKSQTPFSKRMNASAIFFFLILGSCNSASIAFLFPLYRSDDNVVPSSSLLSPLFYQNHAEEGGEEKDGGQQQSSSERKWQRNDNKNSNNDDGDHCRLDVNPFSRHEKSILNWLNSLTRLERSEPEWMVGNNDVLRIRPSLLVQEHLESLMPRAPPAVFETEWERAKFDFEWRDMLLRSMQQTSKAELPAVLSHGRSNSHPLRLQLVAIPANTTLRLHAHPSLEVTVPLVGTLYECRSNSLVHQPSETLSRQPMHSIGTPLSDFSERPTAEELNQIAKDLSNRVILPDSGRDGRFRVREAMPGEGLVNSAGSVHQSYTKNDPCLLLALGPNIHAHFLPGNFHQREGIEHLVGIDDLLV